MSSYRQQQAGRDVRNAVQSGGRFVVYQYCISIFILTFRRNSAVQYIPPGGDRITPGLKYTLLSLALGWWGLPFGPIFTPNHIKNTLGGREALPSQQFSFDRRRR